MDSLEDDRVTGRILYTLRSNAFMMLMLGSVAVLLIAGLMMSARQDRAKIRVEDQTWSVEETMREVSPAAESTEQQVRDLSDLGYSPEVAQAIVENEERARSRRN